MPKKSSGTKPKLGKIIGVYISVIAVIALFAVGFWMMREIREINEFFHGGSSGVSGTVSGKKSGGGFRSCTEMTIGGQPRYDCTDYDGKCKETFINGQYKDMWVESKTSAGNC